MPRSTALRIDLEGRTRVETPREDLWVERQFDGEYSDVGANIERDILADLRTTPWEEVVAERFAEQNPWLYRIITDRGRSLFLDLLSIKRGSTFLDVGSGWGQVAVPLSKYGDVYCLDVSLSRLEILREIARQEDARLRYICGNFCTFPFAENQFDVVIFNGSFEWLALGAQDRSIWDVQRAALEKTRCILRPKGVVYIGIENSLGLKYVLGAPDDHSGIPNLTFCSEAAAKNLCERNGTRLRAKTWSITEYRTLLDAAGLTVVDIFGCFPDYKRIRQMIPIQDVDAVVAEKGLPYPEHSGSDGTPLPFGDRLDHLYRLLGKNGIAQYFCPSYALIAEKPG